jgi:hypothetical protein
MKIRAPITKYTGDFTCYYNKQMDGNIFSTDKYTNINNIRQSGLHKLI